MLLDLSVYDRVVFAFSAGKDSIACLLTMIEQGLDLSRTELWHHNVDGRGEDLSTGIMMDWPCTPAYCEAFAAHIGVPIYHTWKCGGFDREVRRDNTVTAPIKFECPQPNGSIIVKQTGGNRGKPNTRRRFPQISADLSVRFCSSYLKIDNARTALRNQERFQQGKTLFVSGERAEESPGRAKYAEFEPDDADLRNGLKVQRWIDRYRPVHKFTERQVWDLLKKYRITPHPCYRLGWSRCSCMACIFNGANEFASMAQISPQTLYDIGAAEKDFGWTMKRNMSIEELVAKGTAFDMREEDIRAALSETWYEPMITDPWILPAGAFRGGAGPT